MLTILTAALSLIVAVEIILNLPAASSLAQSSLSGSNTQEVAGLQTSIFIPQSKGEAIPQISAAGALIEDIDNGFIFYEKDPNQKLAIASTTKIMTALVAVDYFKGSDILVVSALGGMTGSNMGLQAQDKLSFRSLLYGMLLNSGNDAAFAIAENYPGGKEAFIQKMNEKAVALGLKNTHFDNPAGFDSPHHFSSALDLAQIAKAAMDNPQISQAVGTKETTVFSADNKTSYPLKNLNKLLGLPGVLGIKTGTTPEAKENFVGLFLKHNRRILTIVLGSNNRFNETSALLAWLDTNFIWQ